MASRHQSLPSGISNPNETSGRFLSEFFDRKSLRKRLERVAMKQAKKHVTSIYTALMLAVEERRLQLGLPMEGLSEWSGLSERSYSKYLHPCSASGRQATWPTLDVMMQALFPHGYRVVIEAAPGQVIRPDDLKAQLLKLREKFPSTHNQKPDGASRAAA